MPFSENHEQRPQPTLQPDGSREDRISQAYTMYAVFCTANIPSKVMNAYPFIFHVFNGFPSFVGLIFLSPVTRRVYRASIRRLLCYGR